MRVLVLGPNLGIIAPTLVGEEVISTEGALSVEEMAGIRPDFVISFGYRHILTATQLECVSHNALNVHISLLPWNRGADPNLWSWLSNTPKGVSIHWMTDSLDKGDLAAQRVVELERQDSLSTTYSALMRAARDLLHDVWPEILDGLHPHVPQAPGGSYHAASDKIPHLAALTQGWDTRCGELEEYGRVHGLWVDSHESPADGVAGKMF